MNLKHELWEEDGGTAIRVFGRCIRLIGRLSSEHISSMDKRRESVCAFGITEIRELPFDSCLGAADTHDEPVH